MYFVFFLLLGFFFHAMVFIRDGGGIKIGRLTLHECEEHQTDVNFIDRESLEKENGSDPESK